MPTKSLKVSTPLLGPLSEEERREARAVAERLAVEVTRLLASLEPQHRNASALARRLRIDRTGVQRLISAVADVDEEVLARVPGPKALRRFIGAYATHVGDGSVVQGFADAIDRFEAFLSDCGKHQSGFRQRLLLTKRDRRPAVASMDLSARKVPSHGEAKNRLFDIVREFSGRWSDVQTQIAIIRPSENQENVCDVVRARGLIGHVQEGNAQALVFTHLYAANKDEKSLYDSLRPDAESEISDFLLREFCSPNWILSSMIEGNALHQIAEREQPGLKSPADIVLASVSRGTKPDPRLEDPPTEEIWVSVEFPARRLILDVYLHNDLARGCTYGADTHAPRLNDPGAMQAIHRRWMTRIGPPLPLVMLGTGLEASGTTAYARQRPLTETLFREVGWDAQQYVGFRLETEFPLWRTALRMHFNFEK